MWVLEAKTHKHGVWRREGQPSENFEEIKERLAQFVQKESFQYYHAARTRKLEENERVSSGEPINSQVSELYSDKVLGNPWD